MLQRHLRLWDFRHASPPPYYWVPLMLLAVANWLPGLAASYAIDETGGYYVASAGPLEAVRRSIHHTGQSPAYGVVLSIFLWPLESPYWEAASRIPSLLGLAGATWMIYRLGERFVARGAGLAAALIFAAIPGVASVGMQARQYGLLWFTATAYLWVFWTWFTENRPRDLWVSRLLLALCISFHYLAVLLVGVELLTVLLARRFTARYAAATALAAAGAMLPVLFVLPGKLAEAGLWRYSHLMRHNYWNLDGQLPLRLTVGLALTWLAARLLWPRVSRPLRATAAWRIFLLSWAVLMPLALALLSLWSETFQVRYVLLAAPAAALLAADALARLAPSARALALLVPLVAVLVPGRLLAPGGEVDFRSASETIAGLSLYENSPLLVPSWFVEAHVTGADALYRDYPGLYGHLFAYPVPNAVHPLPAWYSDRHLEPALAQLLDGTLKGEKRLLVALTPWTRAFHRPFTERGWRVRLHTVQWNLVVAECVRD